MKRTLKIFYAIALLLSFFVTAQPGYADGPPPPPPGGVHGGSGNAPPGGGAPVGEGVMLIVMMAVSYGIMRIVKFKCSQTGAVDTTIEHQDYS